MLMMEDTDLDAVPLFAIDRVGFASDVIVDFGGGHQVAFVGRIDEDLADKLLADTF